MSKFWVWNTLLYVKNNRWKKIGVEYWALPGSNSLWRPWIHIIMVWLKNFWVLKLLVPLPNIGFKPQICLYVYTYRILSVVYLSRQETGMHTLCCLIIVVYPNKHNTYTKVEKILKGSLDLIPSPSPSVKIQIMGEKICLRCKGKTLLGVVNKLLKTKSLLTSTSNVLPYYLK